MHPVCSFTTFGSSYKLSVTVHCWCTKLPFIFLAGPAALLLPKIEMKNKNGTNRVGWIV